MRRVGAWGSRVSAWTKRSDLKSSGPSLQGADRLDARVAPGQRATAAFGCSAADTARRFFAGATSMSCGTATPFLIATTSARMLNAISAGVLAADVDAHRAAQSGELVRRDIEVFLEPPPSRVAVAAAADRADIKRRRLERLEQGQVVELGVVRQRDHNAAPVGREGGDGVVGHVGDYPGRRRRARSRERVLARIAHGHVEAAEEGHRRAGTPSTGPRR